MVPVVIKQLWLFGADFSSLNNSGVSEPPDKNKLNKLLFLAGPHHKHIWIYDGCLENCYDHLITARINHPDWRHCPKPGFAVGGTKGEMLMTLGSEISA